MGRSIPNKLGGVLGLFGSLLVLLVLPFIHVNRIKRNTFYPLSKIFFWVFVISFFMLTLGGAWPVEDPYVSVRQFFSLVYFFFFFYAYIRGGLACGRPLRKRKTVLFPCLFLFLF